MAVVDDAPPLSQAHSAHMSKASPSRQQQQQRPGTPPPPRWDTENVSDALPPGPQAAAGPTRGGAVVEAAAPAASVASPKVALGDRSNTADALIEGSADNHGKPAPPASAAPTALSPGTLIRQVREVTGRAPLSQGEGDAGSAATATVAAKKEASEEGVVVDDEASGVNTDAEIGDIDRRLNQLQEFLRQAKEGQAAS